MKKSIFSLLAVVTMAGCTQGDVVELVPNENVEIKLTSSAIAAETMTRAPYEGTIGVNGSLTARVLVSETSGSYTTTYANDKMTFTDNGTTAVGFLNIIRQTTALCISAACIRLRIGALRPMTNASLHSMAARM